jgi:NAD(P)-dependent dehydrogenase (short-subunit alcohol dehydrogenase family)
MELNGRVVLLTGAKRIGAAIAEAAAAQGADVAICYHQSKTEADAVAATIEEAGRRALVVEADIAEPEDCASLVATVGSELGRLDVLVNMASVYRSVPLEQVDIETWDRQMAVDLRGSFLCAQAAVPLMRKQKGGRIINFTDWVAASGRPRSKGYSAYYIAKVAVKALTEALALELATDQILVNAVAPGPILPPPETSQKEIDAVVKATPLGRWGGAEEIVKAVLALIETDFITGETIRVDGGRHLH